MRPLMLAAFAPFLSLSGAHATDLEVWMDCWEPDAGNLICGAGAPDVRAGDPITFYATLDPCTFFCDDLGGAPWVLQFRDDAGGTTVGEISVGATGQYSYTWAAGYAAPGAYRPEVRACANNYSSCTDWDAYDVAFVEYDLDAGDNQDPSVEMLVWDPHDFNGVCEGGGDLDGLFNTTFTFNAEVSDPEGDPLTVEWDFDADGTPDAVTSVTGDTTSPQLAQTTHAYVAEVAVEPAVRVSDDHGGSQGWTVYTCALTDIDLNTIPNQAPVATMEAFTPNDDNGICEGGGSVDGLYSTEFTFHAVVEDLESLDVAVEWDFDEDGVVDLRTPSSGFVTAGAVQATWTYLAGVSVEPQVRAVDALGAVGLWDKYDCAGFDIDLDTLPNRAPEFDVLVWQPNDANLVCDGGGDHDGRPGTSFSFTVEVDDLDDDLIAVEWDFDQDGNVDRRTPTTGFVAEGSIPDVWVYGVEVDVEPQVRVLDSGGEVSAWDAYACGLVDIDLDVLLTPPAGEMLCWSPGCTVHPDGTEDTLFTFYATYADGDPDLGGRITTVEWDLTGDGSADVVEAVADTTGAGQVATTWTYGTASIQVPAVRFTDNDGANTGWLTMNGEALATTGVQPPGPGGDDTADTADSDIEDPPETDLPADSADSDVVPVDTDPEDTDLVDTDPEDTDSIDPDPGDSEVEPTDSDTDLGKTPSGGSCSCDGGPGAPAGWPLLLLAGLVRRRSRSR